MTSEVVGKVNACSSKVEFKWEINNFCADCKKVGDRLKSPNFTTYSYSDKLPREIQWYLELYPKGEDDDSKDHLSIFLNAVVESDIEFTASCTFKLLNGDGKVIIYRSLPETVFTSKYSWGHRQYFKSDMLSNGKITLVCEITMPADEEDEMKLNKEEQEIQEQDEDYI